MCPPAFVTTLAGRLNVLYGNLRNREPLITPETTLSARHVFNYDGTKICRALGFEYTSIAQCIQETGSQFLKEHGH